MRLFNLGLCMCKRRVGRILIPTDCRWFPPSVRFASSQNSTEFYCGAQVTGVFCQSAIESAQNDHLTVAQSLIDNREAHISRLRTLFEELGFSAGAWLGDLSMSPSEEIDWFYWFVCIGFGWSTSDVFCTFVCQTGILHIFWVFPSLSIIFHWFLVRCAACAVTALQVRKVALLSKHSKRKCWTLRCVTGPYSKRSWCWIQLLCHDLFQTMLMPMPNANANWLFIIANDANGW